MLKKKNKNIYGQIGNELIIIDILLIGIVLGYSPFLLLRITRKYPTRQLKLKQSSFCLVSKNT